MTAIASHQSVRRQRAPTRDVPRRGVAEADTTRSVADHLVDLLRGLDIPVIFGVHGANIEHIYDAAVRAPGMAPVVAKHEFAAGAMADGTARITGGYGAVITTSGGGAMNVLPALAESYDSRVPVLALIGMPPCALTGAGAFQDMLTPPDTIDFLTTLSGVVGSCEIIRDAREVDAAMCRAAATLASGYPAALAIPRDVQASDAVIGAAAHEWMTTPEPFPDREIGALAAELARLRGRGRTICVWVGEEASVGRLGNEIDLLAAQLGAQTVASPGGRDAVGDVRSCAGVTGVMGHPSARRAIAEADVVLSIGCRMSVTDRFGLDDLLAERPVVHLGRAAPRPPEGTGGEGSSSIECPDLPAALHRLSEALRDSGLEPGRRPAAVRTSLAVPSHDTGTRLSLRRAIEIVGASMPPGCAVFADAGNAGAAATHHLPFGPGRFTVALGMGGMGYAIAAGVGYAISASVAHRRQPRRTVVIAGDGAFFMHGMEIHTAIEYSAPVTLVILNNDAHGMCITREKQFFPGTPSLNRFGHTDFAPGLAAMFPGLDVRTSHDPLLLRAASADLLTADGPNCLVIDVDPDEIPPFAPFLNER
ncbi:thiamine pyrophosphate-binding protein [Gordonia sp. ABSL1-1]|uniref:thiamine pyrophosphate-binding protein n=1 Tax=Gordonia sp. ABSL1-1 TaxID=3053923 RepID=UPI0025744D0E|nr:thiamine pyrophosphate-binding protein [Gordonia sp. ABSL1-1]MDL9937986.1 thiamine pyrophosphate-binding protein [Gordonia sp. ABSL1-1]